MAYFGKCKTVIEGTDGSIIDEYAIVEDQFGNSLPLAKDDYQNRGILPDWENLEYCGASIKQVDDERP